VPSNILQEFGASIISKSKCKEAYEGISELPYGIINSQFCVENAQIDTFKVQDTW